MDRQSLRDWVVRYNADGVAGLRDRPRSGRPAQLTDGEVASLRALVLRGPAAAEGFGALAAWRLKDLVTIVAERYGATYSESGLWRLLKSLDLAHLTARPIHPAADPAAQAAFKKTGRRR
jgi:transposase